MIDTYVSDSDVEHWNGLISFRFRIKPCNMNCLHFHTENCIHIIVMLSTDAKKVDLLKIIGHGNSFNL